jgi:acetamidase/formamidase
MATHHYRPAHYHLTLGPHQPGLHVSPGDSVFTTTVDAWGYDEHGEQVSLPGNPQTGPFYVDGAEPGDTLLIRFDQIVPSRARGVSSATLAPNVVEPRAVPALPENAVVEWDIDRTGLRATLRLPETELEHLSLPLVPMLGCFGVAPPRGQAISAATAGEHGGNMDYRGFVAGVTVHLPVFVPGALFSVGDGHALQGAGEIGGTGIETSMDVQFTIHLVKGETIGWPRGENAEYIFTVGNARPLEQALQHATTEMYHWLTGAYGLQPRAASILLGQCVDYEVGNVFDPAYTIACKLPKRVLPEVVPPC